MKIILSPVASNKTTEIEVTGLVLTIDGQEIDLSIIPEGGSAESDNELFIGLVTRDEVTIRYEYNSQLAESSQSTDWDDYTFEINEGRVPSPIKWKEEEEINV